MNKQRTTILLIDDHAILREGYQQLLESAGFEVIGQSGNAEEGYQAFIALQPWSLVRLATSPNHAHLMC